MRTPVRWWTRRIADRRQRATVRRIVDEFQQTGDLVQNLPAEIDIVHRVRKIRHDEKRWRNERAARLASNATVVGVQSEAAETQSEAVLLPFRQPATDPTNSLENQPLRFRLAAGDPLVDAPSIGPKTARRFAEIGIASVDQFLRCDPAATADRLATGWISADTISGWQTQARLMCQIPDLLCRDAQMISGAGYTAAAGVAAADPQTLYDRVASFAATSSGQRYLRGGPLPAPQDAVRWQRDAARAIECSQRRLA